MSQHFQAFVSVMPIIVRDGQVLLHRRRNTGYMDGYWDLAGSGHVEARETASQALLRECQEELGICPLAPRFIQVTHKVEPEVTYIYFYFLVEQFTGTPFIREPEKSAALAWFPLNQLPSQCLPYHVQVLQDLGPTYRELQLPRVSAQSFDKKSKNT